ncbi:MAG: peptidoglycan DD-metalloendopeptidase family protein [bacterium]|nr:peptidoglycan DD-metalloendopeptidase family protein [bacterium]
MANVTKIIVFLLLGVGAVHAQDSSDKLKKEQQRLESKIANTKMLLKKTQSNKDASFNELQVIENQIYYRSQLLKNYDNQIRGAELKVEQKTEQIEAYGEKIERLKAQYKKLILYAYKNRNKYGRMMFIFAAKSYHEAIKRNNYLKRVAEIQENQFIAIAQHQELIQEEIKQIDEEKQRKLAVVADKKKERAAIEEDRKRQEAIYREFKEEEDAILAKLKKEERDREVLRQRIAAAIQREIAEAEARRKAAEAKNAAKNTASTSTKSTTTTKATPSFEATKESAALSANFEGNRGKLPWPVEKGTVTEKFGKNPHPTLKNVTTNNRGIDISAPKNAQVRAVFEGEVTSVLNIPGAGKVVIIKHGDYRTVYSNLQDTYVTVGQKVSTKKVIGSLLSKKDQSISVAHFEIHKVVGSNVTCLNPSLWVHQ